MPEKPEPKEHVHPWRGEKKAQRHEGTEAQREDVSSLSYAELHVTSNFTFLTGASHPDELMHEAAALGYRAIAITDINSLAGIVRAHVAAKEAGIQFVVGCRLQFAPSGPSPLGRGWVRDESGEGHSHHECHNNKTLTPALSQGEREQELSVLAFPSDRAAYGRLCQLLTLGRRRAPKGECHLTVHDLPEHHGGLLAVIVPPKVIDRHCMDIIAGLQRVFDDDRLSIATSCLYGEDERGRFEQLMQLSQHMRVPLVATNDVHYHTPQRRMLQDVVTCIRHRCTLDEAGYALFPHGERYLKPPDEIARLFADCPQAVRRSIDIAERAAFNLDELRYEYPDETCPPGKTPMQHLRDLTWQGAAEHYPGGVPAKVRSQIEHEFELIDELNYAPYFLTVHDLVVFARSQGILCQGRGAAANSAVCYCIGVTAVDPARINLLFERFVSRERNEPPDIDIDFEHERREEVIQYIYRKYGRHRAALTAEVISYRGRSAVRDVGKALGLSLDCVDRMAKNMDWWDKGNVHRERIAELGLNPDDETIHRLTTLVRDILGFPRHLSQHVGGFVITRGALCEMVPIENAAMEDRTVIEWDKDDIDAVGMLKVDCLGLGMLTCLGKAFGLIEKNTGQAPPLNGGRRALSLHSIPAEDPRVYDMICDADTVGVFQIESRAQMSMLPRLRPRCYYDLVIEVAIVRPGPIVGQMVHPYLRRRNGEEPVTYPDDKVKHVLGKTLGVPLFQEQAMQLAIVAAGFTPGEADQLRRAIAAWKSKEKVIFKFGAKLVEGMVGNGYPREFAERCFDQLKGFSEYGFPESHAASFALIVYASAWLKCYYPAAFAAALINSQPMGFYAPAQIVRDAQEHGVEVRDVDVNCSGWDCLLEDDAMRLGMRMVKGLRQEDAEAVAESAPYASIDDLWRRSGVRVAVLRKLAQADAFRSMGLDRQGALWEIRELRDERLPLFEEEESTAGQAPPLNGVRLPQVGRARQVVRDYQVLGLSLKAHPLSFLRDELDEQHVTPTRELKDEARWPYGAPIAVSGLVLVRQRPGTASGVVFMTLEDETGIANLIIRPRVFERYRKAARHGIIVIARGRVERQGQVVHVMTTRIEDIGGRFVEMASRSRDFH